MTTCPPRPPQSRIDAGEHLRLARRVVVEFLNRWPEHRYLFDDLLAAAQLGLAEAADRHDGRGDTWGTYAYRYARGYMLIALRSLAYPTRPSRINGEFVSPRRVGLCDPLRSGEDTGPTVEDTIASEAQDAEAAAMSGEVAREVEALLATLGPYELEVIRRRFGLCGTRARTLAQVGRELGVSKQYIDQVEGRALDRLRRAARRRGE